jgi:hypothetical protein
MIHFKRLCVLLLVAASPSVACAQWWDRQAEIAPGKWAVLGRTFVYTGRTYDHAIVAIADALQRRDFAKVQRMHDEFLAMQQAGGNGRAMLGAFPEAIERAFSGGRPEQFEAMFAQWREQAPDSGLRTCVEAAMWLATAWTARGTSYASEVSPEAFKIFNARLQRAARVLHEGEEHGRHSPLWYVTAVNVAGSAGEPSAAVDGIFEEGNREFPLFMALYGARLNYLLPKWGGDYDRVDAFIRGAVLRTQATVGTSLYAFLYERVAWAFQGEDFFRETHASWRLMRHGYEDQVTQGIVNLNRYATSACMARDRETTRRLLVTLGDDADLGAGYAGFTTEACVEMLKEGR